MAGKPGMKGGGGKRPGAGRKKAEAVKLNVAVPQVAPSVKLGLGDVEQLSLAHKDPKIFLLALMNDLEADIKLRADAAKSLMPFMHNKLGEGGKKEQQAEAAKKVASKFASATPPKLVAAGGRKV